MNIQKRLASYPIAIAAFLLLFTAVAQAKPGLIAAYSDGKHTARRVVSTPNFTLAANESVHSQIAAKFDAVYTGLLTIRRGGEYTISGDAKIAVDGNDVGGKTVKLSAGDHPLKIIYSRKAGPARLQLRWKSDFFIEEPIPPAAFGHAKASDALTAQWASIEQGRTLYESLNCGACHGAAGWNLSARKGPDLSDIGSRVTADWLHAWLKNPHSYRKDAVMPVLLTNADELRDVTAYLSKLAESPATDAKSAANPKRIAAGKEIFGRVGCSKCHSETKHSLASVGSKYSSSHALAGYLADPLHVDPSGRMPQMFDPKTQAGEAELVAEFLFHTKKNKAAWPKHPAGGNADRGRALIESRGCVSCHAVKQGGKLLADKTKSPPFTARVAAKGNAADVPRFDPKKGCLAATPAKASPNYELSAADRASLQAFMTSVSQQPVVAKAPVETFYRRVSQFNCTACHALNDQNNGPAQVITDDGKVVSIERPPSLTAAGNKLQVSWLHNVLVKKKRARPWMKMRMPHFGSELESLPSLFPAASGSELVDKAPPPNFDIAKAGLVTIGTQRGQTSCITCHNYRGINNQKEGVVPAPDMAEIGQTLRSNWFRRWLHNPPRMAPGTSMPQFFLELKGDAREKKIDELWAALVHQARLPLPKGLIDVRTEGTRIVVGDDPVLFRASTRVPPKLQIDRAINVGLPGGTNFTFDAAAARLRYAWKGSFINAAAAWNGRGGNPVNAQGASLYIAPSHFPLRIGSSSAEPKVRFLGYYLVKKYPVFRYSVDGVEVHERIEVSDTALVRRFTIDAADKSVSFIGDKKRKYTSTTGAFKDGVLTIPAGKKIAFEVRTTLTPGRSEADKPLKWFSASAKPPRSKSGGTDTAVIFENKSKRRVKIVWVGYGGELKTYGELDPGQSRSQNTYSGSTWVIADKDGKPLGHVIAKQFVSRAIIPGTK